MNALRTIPLVLLVAATLSPRAASASVYLVDNLNESPSIGALTGSDHWFAQGFTAPGDLSYHLKSVSLKLALEPGFNIGSFTISLWDATGPNGLPQNPISTIASDFQVSSLSEGFYNFIFESSPEGSVTLASATSYFLVLTASDPSSQTGLLWADTESQTFSGEGQLGSWTTSRDLGASWDPLSASEPFQMAIEVTPVPEPALFATLTGASLLGFALLRRKSKRLRQSSRLTGDRP